MDFSEHQAETSAFCVGLTERAARYLHFWPFGRDSSVEEIGSLLAT